MASSGRKKHRLLKFFLKLQVVLILFVIAGITYYYVGGYASKVSRLRAEALRYAKNATEDTFRAAETSIAYDADGNVLSILKGEKDVYYLEYSQIPIYAKEAIISIEDKKFYDHKGVDYKAIVRAAYAMFRNRRITQGGSTITQQLARGLFLTTDKTWERKIEEIYIAIELERKYSKNQILEYYLNNIYFANGYYGIEAAAQGYFSKSSQELTLSQIAFLCAIPNSPNRYNPLEDMDSAMSRRNLILRNMLDDGIISEEEFQKSLIEEISLNMKKKERHDYQETYLFYCATRALMELEGFEFKNDFPSKEAKETYESEYKEMYAECNRKLYREGYRIYTSLDSKMQGELQSALDDELNINQEKNEEGIYALQGSGVCIDNETGLVKAIVGGRKQNYDGYTLNRAYQSFRQPGSAIKPLVVYTPALQMGYDTESIISDESVENGPLGSGANITLRRAVELSRNAAAWRLIEQITPNVALSYLKAMKFSAIEETDKVPAISLGGFTRGASALEMAAGFSTLQNEGYYREPTCITKINDSRGETIYQPEMVKEEVYRDSAAKKMTDILRGVFTAPGATGRALGLDNMDCAGKTGTTNDNKDGWFVGYTPYYTTAVWVGFDTPREFPELKGATLPGHVWQRFMNKIHEGLEYKALLSNILPPEEGEEEPNPNLNENGDIVVETIITETTITDIPEEEDTVIVDEDTTEDTYIENETNPE